ncbi:putative capsid protein [Bovine faeces associated smacovirus 5]|uniref:Putative capsid protein n=1 Tax=Bovine faeces associated smacovirus 5 TaxID=1843753 RepID=A0A168MFL0_9VIRU|nr:putative capsid protein [Bovine faeces associated smacovirus 5]ANC51536.1 putative capsid protein [Bovine faeces associated smacovirus 5]
MVTVRISELYDMKTEIGKIGLLGVHTPTGSSIAKRWHGLMINHKFMRIKSCDIRVACAFVLPADPLQVGTDTTDEGLIAPQDIMNPILYRAVTNEGWNTVINRVYSSAGMNYDVNSVLYTTDAFPSFSEGVNDLVYYGLLGQDEWRKAMPQAGLSMSGLRPLVYPLLSSYGNTEIMEPSKSTSAISYPPGQISGQDGSSSNPGTNQRVPVMRGHAVPMPRLPCTTPGATTVDTVPEPVFTPQYIPKSYVACIVMPPAKMHSLFFRLAITWYIEFTDLCTALDKETAGQVFDAGDYTYRRTYSFTAGKSLKDIDDTADEENSIDSLNAPVHLVVEK